jgi:hypothetical protein
VAIKIFAQVWKTAGSDGTRRLANEWIVQRRESSRWDPHPLPAVGSKPSKDALPPEPTWAETQPWWHD